MLNHNYTGYLIGMEEAIVTNVERDSHITVISLMMKRTPHPCPKCKTLTDKIHDYRTQSVKDVPAFGTNVILNIRKRRYVCPVCQKRFYEVIPILPKYQRTTNRLWAYILNAFTEVHSMKSIGKHVNVSATTVARSLNFLSYTPSHLPEVISIDEFRGDADGKKFQCILTNPKKKQVVDILPDRKAESLYAYFSMFDNREKVKYVVMDMSNLFRSCARVCFPKAKIVADKFHVQRLVTWAFEDMRKKIQKSFHHERRKYFKQSRWIMLKNKEDLKPAELEQLSLMLSMSKDLAQAYYLMQEFKKLMKANNPDEAKKALSNWFMHVGVTDHEKFKRFYQCTETFTKWEEEILNAFDSGLTNGYTEGCNNRIKVIKRNAYGMRNFDHFRTRILHVMNS